MRSKYELDEDEMRAMLNHMEILEAVLIYATLKAGGVLTIPRAEMEHFTKKYEDYAIVIEVGMQESTFRTMPQSLHPNDLDALPAQVRAWYSEQDDGTYLIHLRPHCSNLEQALQPTTKDNTND